MTAQQIREKTSARRVLAILVGLLATVMALQGLASVKPGGFQAFAQATSSPSGPTIRLINPDSSIGGTGEPGGPPGRPEISSKANGTPGTRGTTYHLVAWVNQLPENPIVEFQFQASGSTRADAIFCQDTISNQARQVGTDTFECDWNVPAVDQGGTLRAILFSAGRGEVARDQETVTINNTGSNSNLPQDPENQSETVEITYPLNAQTVGFYTPVGGNIATGVIDVSLSEGAEQVEVFFSRSAPGSEPTFSRCGGEGRAGALLDGVRCALPTGVAPESVTAIAARANDQVTATPANFDPESADAHRAFGYEQDPTSVFFLDGTQTQNVPGSGTPQQFGCSRVIQAQVLDQMTPQRRVAGVNVDVHAVGPSDGLSFDDDDSTGNNTSRSQAPDQGGHSTEGSINCENNPPNRPSGTSLQGEHERAGESDLKHIESQAGGTNDNGVFTFQLFSPDPGSTQFTAWADEDGNDLFCSAEAAGNGSIGFGQDPPSPTGLPAEQETCPRPTPRQSQSPTGSPSGTPTGTPTTPSGTNTASPSGTSTTRPGSQRTVTLAADDGELRAGRQVTFSGQIISNDASCADGDEFVQIRRRVLGTTSFRNVFSASTDSQGRFSVTDRPTKSAEYIAVVEANDNCEGDISDEVTVLVRVKLRITPSENTPDRGERIRIKGSVRPHHDGTKMILQRKKNGRFVRFKVDTLNKRSFANYVFRARFNKAVFRVKWNSQDEDHVGNTSRQITIRTR